MPEANHSVTAVIVSGGKQYRVAPGDQILVGRLKAEVGTELRIERVLLHDDGDTLHVGNPDVAGVAVMAKVLRHSRGPRLEMLRYKSKKRVRVHKGARADYTAVEILAIGDHRPEKRSAAKDAVGSGVKDGETPARRSRRPTAKKASQTTSQEPPPETHKEPA